jgi:long-chain acyl-CoA synthetase
MLKPHGKGVNKMSPTFLRLIEAQVCKQPQQAAIISSDRVYSYQQLWDEVTHLRQLLRSLSVRHLAVALSNCPAWIALDLAAAMEQIPFVPVPHFFSVTQIRHLTNDADIDHFIRDARFSEHYEDKNGSIQNEAFTSLGTQLVITSIHASEQQNIEGEYSVSEISAPAYFKISYTSGTSGEPKGVLISRELVDRTVNSLLKTIGVSTASRHLSVLPFSLLLENIVGIYAVLASGGCCFVPDFKSLGITGSSNVDWQKFTTVVQSVNPTSMITVPALLQGLIHCVENFALETRSLQYIAVGGAPISRKLLDHASRLGLPAFQGYGLTECGSVVCLNTLQSNRSGSVGKPLPHIKISIDNQGEIIIGGVDFAGYTNQPASHPKTEWATGDLGYFDEQGFLYVTARKSSAYSTAYGRNIAPEWVESELDGEAVIAQSVVFGEGQKQNVSVIVPIASEIDNAQLAQGVENANQRLPDYAQVGAWIRADSDFNHFNRQRSPSGALQRKQIYFTYQNAIEQLFGEAHL